MANMLMMRYAARKYNEHPYDNDAPEMRRGRDRETGRYVHRPDRRMEHESDRRIGFGANDERSAGSYHNERDDGVIYLDEERTRRRGSHDYDDDDDDEITREKAEKWVANMAGSDPAIPHGGKWTMEAVKPFAQKYGFPTSGREFYEFYVVMNAMYSDYYDVAKKFGVANPDFFAELAKCFIKDKDANPGKVEMYFKHIAKK